MIKQRSTYDKRLEKAVSEFGSLPYCDTPGCPVHETPTSSPFKSQPTKRKDEYDSSSTTDPAYEAKHSYYGQNRWLRNPSSPVGVALTLNFKDHTNCNFLSGRNLKQRAKQCSRSVPFFTRYSRSYSEAHSPNTIISEVLYLTLHTAVFSDNMTPSFN
ncbi:UNVERIFIED_CONTAM: hypothetical protein NCL1_32524 [Trichonephila clavipes]